MTKHFQVEQKCCYLSSILDIKDCVNTLYYPSAHSCCAEKVNRNQYNTGLYGKIALKCV